MVPGLDPVVNVAMQPEGRFAFVEFRNPEMATASLELSGKVQLLGVSLSIGRPAGYVDPVKALAAAQQSAIALAQFQVGTGSAAGKTRCQQKSSWAGSPDFLLPACAWKGCFVAVLPLSKQQRGSQADVGRNGMLVCLCVACVCRFT